MKGSKPLTVVIKLGMSYDTSSTVSLGIYHYCAIRCCVIHVHFDQHNSGTSSIVDEKTHEPLLSILSLIVETAVKLRKDGHKVVIVSSGAIGVGLRRMDVDRRPKHLSKLQALAAIGQCRLISLWDSLFAHLQQPISQILLTRNDIADVR